MANCLACGREIDEFDSAYYARSMMCIPCYTTREMRSYVSCEKCGVRIRADEARRRRGGTYCSCCFSEFERIERLPECPFCMGRVEEWQRHIRLANSKTAHAECAEEGQKEGRANAICSACGQETGHFKVLKDNVAMCGRCLGKAEQIGPQEKPTLMHSFVDRIKIMLR